MKVGISEWGDLSSETRFSLSLISINNYGTYESNLYFRQKFQENEKYLFVLLIAFDHSFKLL